MRDILYKAKSKETENNNKWVKGGIVHQTDLYGWKTDDWYIIDGTNTCDYNIGDVYKVDSNTICQYTELIAIWTDSSECETKREVWEHDILEVEYDGKKVLAEVKYEMGMFILTSKEFADFYIPLFNVIETEGEDVWINAEHKGNSYDNPEVWNKIS